MKNKTILILIVIILSAGICLPKIKAEVTTEKMTAKAQQVYEFDEQGEEGQAGQTRQPTILVAGSEEVSVMPDTAYVNLSVTTKGLSVESAQKENAQIVAAAVEKLGAIAGGENITTSNYSVYPEYEYISGTSKQKGFAVSCSLRVKVVDFTLAGKVVDAAGANGVNGISGIEFSLSDSTNLYNAALSKAVENARNKAQIIAAAHQLKLGAPISIKETEQFRSKAIAYGNMRTFAEASVTTVNPEKLTLKACVEIVYAAE